MLTCSRRGRHSGNRERAHASGSAVAHLRRRWSRGRQRASCARRHRHRASAVGNDRRGVEVSPGGGAVWGRSCGNHPKRRGQSNPADGIRRPVSATTLRGFWLPFSGVYGVGTLRLAVERMVTVPGVERAVPAVVWQAERTVAGPWRKADQEIARSLDEMAAELRATGPNSSAAPAADALLSALTLTVVSMRVVTIAAPGRRQSECTAPQRRWSERDSTSACVRFDDCGTALLNGRSLGYEPDALGLPCCDPILRT